MTPRTSSSATRKSGQKPPRPCRKLPTHQGSRWWQIPVGRLGKPEEVAGLIIYLCSEEAAFVNGANIAINGGQHMS